MRKNGENGHGEKNINILTILLSQNKLFQLNLWIYAESNYFSVIRFRLGRNEEVYIFILFFWS